MKTTIDRFGRITIPRDIRRESGIKPGMPLDVRWYNGTITITPASLAFKLERKGRLLVAVAAKKAPRLSTTTVNRTLNAHRQGLLIVHTKKAKSNGVRDSKLPLSREENRR